jgi:hypothetical protein
MSLWARVKNIIGAYSFYFVLGEFFPGYFTSMFRRAVAADFPSMTELMSRTQLYFINTDIFFEYARPLPPNVIPVGGLTMVKAQPYADVEKKK